MAEYSIPYGNLGKFVSFEIDEERVAFFASPSKSRSIPNQKKLIQESFDNPIGTHRLEELVRKDSRVVVLIDDITRPTPKKILLPEVLDRLNQAGVLKDNIKIVIGLGTHRTLTEEEIDAYVGNDNIRDYSLVNIDYKERSRFEYIGDSKSGTPIEIYREVLEADIKIAIGNIVPHIAAGWGGGAKMIQPGVCSEKTTELTHFKACTDQDVMETCGNAENVVRQEMEDIAGRVGLDYIVNTVLDEDRNILGLFCGDYVLAHREGVKLARELMCPEIPEKADILIVSAYPADVDFWQGCKPFIFAQFGVREGGILIFLLDGREGLSGNAPHHEETLRKWSIVSFEDQMKAIENNEIDDIVGINVPLFHAAIRHRVTTLCVSEGLSVEDKRALGFSHEVSIEEALKKAFDTLGENSTVGIIPYCGETLVRLRQ